MDKEIRNFLNTAVKNGQLVLKNRRYKLTEKRAEVQGRKRPKTKQRFKIFKWTKFFLRHLVSGNYDKILFCVPMCVKFV